MKGRGGGGRERTRLFLFLKVEAPLLAGPSNRTFLRHESRAPACPRLSVSNSYPVQRGDGVGEAHPGGISSPVSAHSLPSPRPDVERLGARRPLLPRNNTAEVRRRDLLLLLLTRLQRARARAHAPTRAALRDPPPPPSFYVASSSPYGSGSPGRRFSATQ